MSTLTRSQKNKRSRRKVFKKVHNIIHQNMPRASYRMFMPITQKLSYKILPVLNDQMKLLQTLK